MVVSSGRSCTMIARYNCQALNGLSRRKACRASRFLTVCRASLRGADGLQGTCVKRSMSWRSWGACLPTPLTHVHRRQFPNPNYLYTEYSFTVDGLLSTSHVLVTEYRADFIASAQPHPPFFYQKMAHEKKVLFFLSFFVDNTHF